MVRVRIALPAGIAGLVAFAVAAPRPAAADDPKYEFAKPPEKAAPKVTWKASAQAGLIITTGNSQSRTMAGGLAISRLEGMNKFQLDLTGAYVRTDVFVFTDKDGDGKVDPGEFARIGQTTAKGYLAKARYDRFLTTHNSLYLTGAYGADVPAGKDLFAGAQLGYSRQLFKSTTHELVAELGVDYTFEDLSAPGANGVSIISGRGFVGYTGTLSADTGVAASVDTQVNLNSEDAPYLMAGTIDAGDDTRVTAKAAVTTKLKWNMSLRFSFNARYDHAPAPLAKIAGVDFDGMFPPLAETLDTTTELSLIVNIL
jgi:hypothetical protein